MIHWYYGDPLMLYYIDEEKAILLKFYLLNITEEGVTDHQYLVGSKLGAERQHVGYRKCM